MSAVRILWVRTSALGDVVHCLPALAALRRARPETAVGWVVEETFAPLLEGHPDLESVIPVATRRWRREPTSPGTWRELAAFRRSLRAFRADVAVDLMGNHKGGVICRLSGCSRRLGAERRDRREPSSAVWINEAVPVAAEHAVDRALATVAPLTDGAPGVAGAPGGDRLLPHVAPDGEAPPILLQPGAGWGNKRYPADRWGAVARRLAEAADLEVGVLAGPGEEGLAGEVVAASGGVARALVDGGLPALVATLRGARLLLGGDTGPVHLAHALGTPVLCLMGPTDPERHGPWGAADRALWKRLSCSFCYRRYDEPKACLMELSAEAVAERALALLASGPAAR